MIATGGLLRINRRQDSLRSKSHKAHPHKKKKKKKRRNEVVVVKGKLKLVSVSGLVAALGIMVLLGGVVMAALGYWPREGLFFSTQPQEGAAMASVSSSSPSPAAADEQGGGVREELQEDKADKEDERGNIDGFNQTETVNGTTSRPPPRGFLEDFLHRYLYSDRLKVFGPLIMGIGIFLFICANAVLHENRDKKTKVINLRDIYSTVIDLHSLRKPNASSSVGNPLNGLVNYIQSKSLETKPRAYPASLSRKEGGGGGGDVIPLSKGGGDGSQDNGGGEEGDPVFSIFQDQPASPPLPPSSHRLSLPPSFSPPQLSLQKEVLTSSTLPLHRPRPDSHSDQGGGKRDYLRSEGEVNACPPSPLPQNSSAASCSSSSLHREVPSGSLSHLLSSSPTPPPPCRRQSLPSGGGYSKLTHGEDESFESTSSHHMGQRSGGSDITQEVLQQGVAEDDLTGGGTANQELSL